MARVVPASALEPPADATFGEREELRVVRRLAQALDDEFWVLHHRVFSVQKPPKGRKESIIEIDVLILHPDMGVLVLEVKSGELQCDEHIVYRSVGGWRKPLDPQPFTQVTQQRDALMTHLGSTAGSPVPARDWRAFVTWGLAFSGTSCRHEAAFLGADSARGRILWKEAFEDGESKRLREAVDAAFSLDRLDLRHRGRRDWQHHVRSSTAGGERAPEERLGPRLRSADLSLASLTDGQSAVLNQMDGVKRVLITGPAGSGKSVLAWEKATRLAMAGRRVLLLAYDPRAIDAVDRASMHSNITADTVEGLGRRITDDEIDPADFDAHDPFWFGRALPDALEVHAATLPMDERFDDLIVDEVFDMWPRVLGALRALLRDEASAAIWLFGDARQGVTWPSALPLNPNVAHEWEDIPPFATFQESDVWGDGVPFERQRLSFNCRNVAPIQRILAGRFFHDGSASLGALTGGDDDSPVQVAPWVSEADLRAQVQRAVDGLIEVGVQASDIAVLHGGDRRLSCLFEQVNDATLDPRLLIDLPEGVEVSSVARFKGDDRQAIILCEMEAFPPTRAQAHWYTALSRARTHVTVFVHDVDGDAPRKINEVLRRAREEALACVVALDLADDVAWPVRS